ncbi:MAG: fumarylacetoacetate hydrolase family protein [Phycisphaeraceae bacterium]|nr:fumarylacetoacetate hydrolase family protein [Phycisphaeraceae bacterium]
MRIVRFSDADGEIHLGVDQGDGQARVIAGGLFESPGGPKTTDQVAKIEKLLAPVQPADIYCIGLNYARHAKETGKTVGDHPVLFMKPSTAVQDPGQPIRIPRSQMDGPEVDIEAELAVIIGREGRDISPDQALDHVLGYTCANDVSARRWQKQGGGGQWIRGKGFDTFCPLGPAIVTSDELVDPQDLSIRSVLNGETMQSSHTGDMIWPVAEIIAFISRDTTLRPGTVILTGTPEGVGVARDPQVFLKPGDDVKIEIDTIGTLANPVVAG